MAFLQQYIYNGRIMGRSPSDAQGLLPTSIYPAADGWVMVSTPPPYSTRMQATIDHYNEHRPPRSLDQHPPSRAATIPPRSPSDEVSVLLSSRCDGLIHEYQNAA